MSNIIYIAAMQKKRSPVIPNRLRELRKARGMTLEALALDADCSITQIHQLEKGTTPMTIEWMRILARALGCAPAEILPDEDVDGILSADERRLIESLRAAQDERRDAVLKVAETLVGYVAEPADPPLAPKKDNGGTARDRKTAA